YITSCGVAGEALRDFLAPVPTAHDVEVLATKALWCFPVLVPAPIPGIELIESPFFGMALRGTHDIVLLRPPTELEQDMATWSTSWEPGSDNEHDDAPDDFAASRTDGTHQDQGDNARRAAVSFRLRMSCDRTQR